MHTLARPFAALLAAVSMSIASPASVALAGESAGTLEGALEKLFSNNAFVQREGAEWLTGSDAPFHLRNRLRKRLQHLLRSRDLEVRRATMRALCSLYPATAALRQLDVLKGAAASKDPFTRRAAAKALETVARAVTARRSVVGLATGRAVAAMLVPLAVVADSTTSGPAAKALVILGRRSETLRDVRATIVVHFNNSKLSIYTRLLLAVPYSTFGSAEQRRARALVEAHRRGRTKRAADHAHYALELIARLKLPTNYAAKRKLRRFARELLFAQGSSKRWARLVTRALARATDDADRAEVLEYVAALGKPARAAMVSVRKILARAQSAQTARRAIAALVALGDTSKATKRMVSRIAQLDVDYPDLHAQARAALVAFGGPRERVKAVRGR